MMGDKRLRGYMMSAISMGIGLTLLSLLLHHRTPSLLLIAGGAVAGVILEAMGNSGLAQNRWTLPKEHKGL